jgi:hypothetical protein
MKAALEVRAEAVMRGQGGLDVINRGSLLISRQRREVVPDLNGPRTSVRERQVQSAHLFQSY